MGKMVYLIESECGRIKLGSSSSPERRLATFSAQSPRPLRLIAKWPGSTRDEQAIHRRFRAYRTHNEWFRPEGEFGEFVAWKRGDGVDEITDWVTLTWSEKREQRRLSQSASMKAHWADPSWRAYQEANLRRRRSTCASSGGGNP